MTVNGTAQTAQEFHPGHVYECDPEAVANLRRLMAEEREKRAQQRKPGRAAKKKPSATAAAILARAKQRSGQQDAPPAPARKPAKPVSRPRPPHAHNYTPAQLDAAIEAHANRMPWSRVAAGMGVNRNSLREALIAAGYDVDAIPPIRLERNMSDDVTRAFYARQLAGESLTALAKEAGILPVRLRQNFRRLGLESARSLGKTCEYTDEKLQAAEAEHAKGRRWKDIAADMGTTRQALCDARRRRGRPVRQQRNTR